MMPIEDLQSQIYSIRGVQVMLDSDLAVCYGVEVKRLNEQVKRNIERFPESFRFQLNDSEITNLKSQFATSRWGGRRTRPYAFTEQGVAMLSAVLRSETAVKMSVHIINAFVAMRRFITSNAQVFQRLDTLEIKQLKTDEKMEMVLNAIESKDIQPKQGIFFDGRVFDAYKFVSDLFRSASKSIVIIDNYLDDSVLTHLAKRRKNVRILLLTKSISKSLALDVKKFNKQYPPIEIKKLKTAHDRFIIIDNAIVYHFGASFKDLGKKWFAFSKMDIGVAKMLAKIEEML
ncbi:MAG: ORF6N domain-containing protein [Thermoplasmata archaeon]|nr:ORF6N domain-containing protein [Thermoplasmata archaeon]